MALGHVYGFPVNLWRLTHILNLWGSGSRFLLFIELNIQELYFFIIEKFLETVVGLFSS